MRTDYMLQQEVERVLMLLMPENRLVMRVVLHTGLRISDVLNLRTDQLAPRFWVRESKTGKAKMVGLPGPLLDDIRAQAGPVWAFPGVKKGSHRTRQAVWADIKRAARACRLPQNIGTHSGRKVYAVELLQKYGDMDRVRRALNHRYESVTMIYAMADHLLMQKFKRRGGARGA